VATLTAPSDVRSEGSLPESSDVDVQDAQLNSAINGANLRMLEIFGQSEYDTVYALGGSDAKRVAFKHAEASFAVAELPLMLTGEQLVRSGLIARKKTGDAEVVFASPEEKTKIQRTWESKAFRWLRDYLTNEINEADDADEQIAFRTKDRRLTIMAI